MTTIMLSFVKNLFANKLVEDNREPLLQFQIPNGENFAILAPQLELWIQLAYVRLD